MADKKMRTVAEAECPKRVREGICITLPAAQREQLRRVAEITGISQGSLRETLEGSKLVADAITEALRRAFNAWRTEQEQKDPFGEDAGGRQADPEVRSVL